MSKDILPTHDCFEDATQIIFKLLQEDKSKFTNPNIFLVHAICLKEDGSKYSHAWIEVEGDVWFSGILDEQKVYLQATKKEFYENFRVVEETKYTLQEACLVAKAHNDIPPPWEHKYQKLCKNYPKN